MRSRSSGFTIAAALGVISLLVMGLTLPSARAAGSLARPSGRVLLTVTGAISQTNAPDRAEFDQNMLEALGVERLTTSTNWTDGQMDFEGVPVRKLLEAVGAKGTAIVATALDEYTIEIPIEDFVRYQVLLALRMNGRPLAAKDKGPIWIVYPRDGHPELRDPTINARWVWQLSTIAVK